MPSITFDTFKSGLDLRPLAAKADADRLRASKNVYSTPGFTIRKRPGLAAPLGLDSGSAGLVAHDGKLKTFSHSGSGVSHTPALIDDIQLTSPGGGATTVSKVHAWEVFNGFIYAALEWNDGTIRHYYMSGAAPHAHVADVNCPHNKSLTRGKSKIFSPDDDTVRFCATGDPTDWTTVSDAGFLPTGLNASGDPTVTAVGRYGTSLAVAMEDSIQTWFIDPDPALMSILNNLDVGTDFHLSFASVAEDLYFLSPFGFRSLSEVELNQTTESIDVGSPIDPLVIEDDPTTFTQAKAVFANGFSQYLCCTGTRMYVFTYSRVGKLSAWTYYDFGETITDLVELDKKLYLRAGDNVYELTHDAKDDNGVLYETEARLPYMDLKKPGQEKFVQGCDVVQNGSCDISFGYDSNDETLFGPSAAIAGDTAREGVIPVEITSVHIAPRFKTYHNQEWEMSAITLYYEVLGL